VLFEIMDDLTGFVHPQDGIYPFMALSGYQTNKQAKAMKPVALNNRHEYVLVK
jgi:hypothetical protein